MEGILEFTFSFLERLSSIRAFLGFILMFFVPGFAWTLVFFKKVNIMERIVLSIGLSMALVTLGLFAFNKLTGMAINGLNSVLFIMVITIIPIAFYYLNRTIRGRS